MSQDHIQSSSSYQAPPPPPAMQTMQSREMFEGQQFAQKALIFGIVGLFFLGIVFGPLAISNAKKAEALHQPAVAGKVLGWICTIWAIVAVIGMIIFFISIATVASA